MWPIFFFFSSPLLPCDAPFSTLCKALRSWLFCSGILNFTSGKNVIVVLEISIFLFFIVLETFYLSSTESQNFFVVVKPFFLLLHYSVLSVKSTASSCWDKCTHRLLISNVLLLSGPYKHWINWRVSTGKDWN